MESGGLGGNIGYLSGLLEVYKPDFGAAFHDAWFFRVNQRLPGIFKFDLFSPLSVRFAAGMPRIIAIHYFRHN